ncbi:MotA/TolQ/ExbB proton channel family protein [Vibrio alfacsensis]|uniref:MotA/TolQ/ExbB proton channel family protein n=1 Tax=Vibrio alfacsensis TaxID=1074311 RepID=UPI004068D35D
MRLFIQIIFAILLTLGWEFIKGAILNGDSFSDTSNHLREELIEKHSWVAVCKFLIIFLCFFLTLLSLSLAKRSESLAKKINKAIQKHELLSDESDQAIVVKDYIPRAGEQVISVSELAEKLQTDIDALNSSRTDYINKRAKNYVLSVVQTYRQTQSINDTELDLQRSTEQLYDEWLMWLTWPNFSRVALPMLGFLGTIIGIMVSMIELAEKIKGKSDPEEMRGAIIELINDIGVAFDTTLIALVMAFIVFAFTTNAQRRLWFVAEHCQLATEPVIRRMKIPNWTKRTDYILEQLVRNAHQKFLNEISREDTGRGS